MVRVFRLEFDSFDVSFLHFSAATKLLQKFYEVTVSLMMGWVESLFTSFSEHLLFWKNWQPFSLYIFLFSLSLLFSCSRSSSSSFYYYSLSSFLSPPPLPRIFRLLKRYKWINYCFLWRFRSSSFFTKFAHGIPSTKLICCHLSHPVDNNRFWMQHNNKILNKLYSVKWPFLYLS